MRKASLAAWVAMSLTVAVAAPFKDGDVVVFFGDSITHGGLYHEYITDFYRTRFPDAKIRFVNSGIGGDTAKGAYCRLPEDIAEYNPTHVAIHFGMNDIGRCFYSDDSSDASLVNREEYQRNYRDSLVKLIDGVKRSAPNAKLTYLTPTPYDDVSIVTNMPADASEWARHNQVGCNCGLSLMAGFVIERAKQDKVDYVNWYSLLNGFMAREHAKDPYFMITAYDRVHPREVGHSIMAWEYLRRQGVPATVSDVAVDAAKGEVVKSDNAEVSELKCKDGEVEFVMLAKALPFPVHPKALPYVGEFDVEKKLNREVLTVSGLADGEYALRIDGIEVGRYSHHQFAEGVHLGFNTKTPQYGQSQRVQARNEELRAREATFRVHHSARWAFFDKAPVDDVNAFKAWYDEDIKKGGKLANSYFGRFIPGYLKYWPTYRESRSELWKDQDAVRSMAKPLPRRYVIRKLGK